jgi:2-succinyl-6-hydroxy-2,4-cyclohexadiene-1-carboxylate synthase
MPFAEINGMCYRYELSGSGPPVLLLHGFTGTMENWQPHTAVLAESFRVLAVDLPGHGQTSAPADPARYRMEQVAADLAQFVSDLTGRPANLLGYSMGGRLALYLAIHYPALVRSLILESASPGLDDVAARQVRIRQDEALAGRIEREGIEAFVNYWERVPLFASQSRLPENVRQRLRDQRLRNDPQGLTNSLRGMGTGVQPSLWKQLDDLKMPVLLLAGALDEKFVRIAQQMYDRMADARLEIVPDAGHTVHLEAPSVFQNHVLDFLTQR